MTGDKMVSRKVISRCRVVVASMQIQTSIQSHAIIILPNTDGIELLVCYEDEGVYVNTYGRITKDVVLQWGEMPTSVGESRVFPNAFILTC